MLPPVVQAGAQHSQSPVKAEGRAAIRPQDSLYVGEST